MPSIKDSIKDTTKVSSFSTLKIDSIQIDTLEYCFTAGEIKSIAEITMKYEELRRYSEEQLKINKDLLNYAKKTENSYNSAFTDYQNLKLRYEIYRKRSFVVVGSLTGIVIVGSTIMYFQTR